MDSIHVCTGMYTHFLFFFLDRFIVSIWFHNLISVFVSLLLRLLCIIFILPQSCIAFQIGHLPEKNELLIYAFIRNT